MKMLASAALLALTLASACTQADETPEESTSTIITVKSFAFEPNAVTIHTGETVEWRWADGTHNVVSGTSCVDDGKFRSGDPVEGATFEHVFDAPGTYDYFCEPHCAQGMVGKVIVE